LIDDLSLSPCDATDRGLLLTYALFFIHTFYAIFSNQINPYDRAQRNMAHSDSARPFSPTVPGPLSSQFPARFARPKCLLFIPFRIEMTFFLFLVVITWSHSHPRRQTLAFKSFLVSISSASHSRHSEFLYYRADAVPSPVTIYGLVSGADSALLSHENQQRLTENDLRREARIDLARRGLVPTESQIMKWKDEHRR
jgi:hypothetical protein